MRGWIIAITLGASAPAIAETCAPERAEEAPAIEPPASAGCAVRPGVGALASLALSIVALGLGSRRSGRRDGP